MVSSFSEGEDQLGQWRGYTSGGAGVSIGFDLGKLRTTWASMGIDFAPCVYSAVAKRDFLNGILSPYVAEKRRAREEILSFMQAKAGTKEGERLEELQKELAISEEMLKAEFYRGRCFMKREEFSEEREWRVS